MSATLFDSDRMTMTEAIDLTVQSLKAYGEKYDHWAIARIVELIEGNTWPNGWSGTEQRADVIMDEVKRGGAVQPVFFKTELCPTN